MSSFKYCVDELKVRQFEIGVRRSQDDIPVVMNDPDFFRLTGVENLSPEELPYDSFPKLQPSYKIMEEYLNVPRSYSLKPGEDKEIIFLQQVFSQFPEEFFNIEL
jgi:hypothetical protein